MDLKSGNSLSEILQRSKRLEKVLPFRTTLTVSTILQRTRNVSRASDDNRYGYLLLSQQKVNIENAREILNGITNPRIISDNYLSFQDRSNFSYQDVIIKSISKVQKSTEKLNDDIILRAFQQKQIIQGNVFEITGFGQQVSVPIHNLDPTRLRIYGNSLKMELVEKAEFYCKLLPKFDENMARNIFDAICTSSSKLFNYESQKYADTFDLIYHLTKYDTIVAGTSAFLESQKKRLIVKQTNENLLYLERGGEIGIIQTIKAYLKLQNSEYSKSPWAVIYYAIRCGERDAASSFADQSDIDNNVKNALHDYSKRIPIIGKLKDTLISYLSSEFQSKRSDIFKVRTLAILTKADRRITLEGNIQDWIWYELQFAKGPINLAEELSKEHRFDKPELQGQILIMTGSFDEAAHWFLDQKQNLIDNLHIVLCLHVLSFIHSDVLLESLVSYAVEVFKSKQESAVRYLSLIQEKQNRINSLAKLVIKAVNGYQMFESKTEPEDLDDSAPIMRVLLPDEADEVLEKSATEARKLDLYDLAIKLYYLRGDFQGILSYDCVQLKRIIKNPTNKDSLNTIKQHFAPLQEKDKEIDVLSLKTMYTLIKLACAVRSEHEGSYEEAVKGFEEIDLFPSSGISAESKYKSLMAMPEMIINVIPFVIVPALQAYYGIYLKIQKDSHSLNYREELRERAIKIKDFSSLLDLDSETQEKIFRLCGSIK